MAKEKITAGLEVLEEALNQPGTQLVAEVNQHVHAENALEASEINLLCEVHGRELDHLPKLRFYFEVFTVLSEVGGDLRGGKIFQHAPGIDAVIRSLQGFAADVGGNNVGVESGAGIGGFADAEGYRVRLFSAGATGAPDAQCVFLVPEFTILQLGQYVLAEGGKQAGIAPEARFLGQQALQHVVVFHVGVAHQA